MELSVRPRRLPLAQPFAAAWGSLRVRDLLEVRLRAADGLVGRGEAAPLEPYDGVALADVQAALERLRAVLADADDRDRDAVLAECWRATMLPQAVAAVDLALWDLAGQRAGRPVAALLAAAPAARVPVNAVVGAVGPEAAARAAAGAVRRGFRCLKLKVGVDGDARRLAGVRRQVGPGVAVRADANGAWGVPEALDALDRLPGGLELVEEPVHGVEALRVVAEHARVPVAMDETAVDAGAWASGATELVCLKLSRCGGISGLLAATHAARDAGATVYFGSTLDGPAGIAAALHAAAALGRLPACGLATLELFAGVRPDHPLAARDGALAVPAAPGLGPLG